MTERPELSPDSESVASNQHPLRAAFERLMHIKEPSPEVYGGLYGGGLIGGGIGGRVGGGFGMILGAMIGMATGAYVAHVVKNRNL